MLQNLDVYNFCALELEQTQFRQISSLNRPKEILGSDSLGSDSFGQSYEGEETQRKMSWLPGSAFLDILDQFFNGICINNGLD